MSTQAEASNKSGDLSARLMVLEKQTEKILSYQRLSYRWSLQHHVNLKKIMLRLNDLLVNLKKAGLITGLADMEITEDKSLMPATHMPTHDVASGSSTSRGEPYH